MLDRIFLDYSIEKLTQLAERVDHCLGKLTEEQVWARGSSSENAVGNLVLHLCGNLRQWILSGVGDAPDMRNRDAEFAAKGTHVPELRAKLTATVDETVSVIGAVTKDRLTQRINVQKYDVTVLAAIYHVVEHFSGHTGQIIFATKMLTGEDLGFYQHLKEAAAHGEKTP